jgi:hypothetical protein
VGILEDTTAVVTGTARGAGRLAQNLAVAPDAAQRALADLAAVGRVARELPARLDALDRRAAKIQEQIDQMLDLGERVVELGVEVNALGGVISDRAKDVADRGGEVVAVLPTLERAIGMAQPLEGAIDRLGRVVDRLPGGPGRRPPAAP